MKKIKIEIDQKGNYAMEALEGYSGESCVNKTKEVELILGGKAVEEGKTTAYYDDPDDNPIDIIQ